MHKVPDALSRMYEGASHAIAALRESEDEWYVKRKKAEQDHPKLFPNCKVEDDKIYYHRIDPLLDLVDLPDLDAWKLVLPERMRIKVLQEYHDLPQAGHLGIDKTYRRVARKFY